MLSKEEEQRLAAFLGTTRVDLEKDVTYASEYYVSSVRWLAEKLKECNDALKVKPQEVLVVHRHSEPFELIVRQAVAFRGTVRVSVCNRCHLVVEAECIHEKSSWDQEKIALTCDLCGRKMNERS